MASNLAKETAQRARRFAVSDETVLITGETGTGKEAFAQSIHNSSRRSARPFIAVSCATIAPGLLASELFGYAEGAFTGAIRGGKQGFFELAHGGTIFLDEIGELTLETQVYFLRVLQEKELMRVGGGTVIPVDVRVIAATNKILENTLQQGSLRSDLYHRLNVLRLRLPPLRKHTEDILPIAHRTLQRLNVNQDLGNRIEAMLLGHTTLLHSYPWPGNIRELENLIRRMVVCLETAENESFEVEADTLLHEAFDLTTSEDKDHGKMIFSDDLKATLAFVEQELVRERFDQWKGNKTQIAKELGIGRTTLWRKLKGR